MKNIPLFVFFLFILNVPEGYAFWNKVSEEQKYQCQQEASMQQNDRKELVGLLSEDPNTVIPEGAHAIDEKDLELEEKNILGHVTSSYFSSNCKRSIAMALIKNGRARKGNKLVIPLLNGDKIKAKIVNPVFFDPNGVRKNGI